MKPVKDEEYSFNHVRERLKERFKITIDRSSYDVMNETVRVCKRQGVMTPISTDNGGEQEVYDYTHARDHRFLTFKIV